MTNSVGFGGSIVCRRRRGSTLSGDAAKGLRGKRVHLLRPSESCIINYPEAAILLPGEIAKEVVFGIDVVAEGLGTEKGVDVATVRELAKYLKIVFSRRNEKRCEDGRVKNLVQELRVLQRMQLSRIDLDSGRFLGYLADDNVK